MADTKVEMEKTSCAGFWGYFNCSELTAACLKQTLLNLKQTQRIG